MARFLFVVAFAFLSIVASANDKQAIVGAWRFAGEVDTKADGTPIPAASANENHGLLIYTSDGFMSVVHMPNKRSWVTETATLDELRATAADGTAYAGRYELDQTTHTVTHITTVSLEPAYEEKRLVRTYALEGNTLKLSGKFTYAGEDIHFTITWVRAGESRK